MWKVTLITPTFLANKGWDFKPEHFPRIMAYKKDAIELAKEATRKGATNVKVEKC